MTKSFLVPLCVATLLAACGGEAGDADLAEPGTLTLTPGAWAANDSEAGYAIEDGQRLATLRCDPVTQELILEMPGGFADGARAAMLIRAGDFMHGVDPVEVRTGDAGPVRIAPMPINGPISQTIIDFPVPLTIETDGAEPLLIEGDAVLQGFVAQCAEATESGGAEPGQ